MKQQISLVAKVAARFSIEPNKFLDVVKKTCFPAGREITNEMIAAYLIVADQYELNPFTREIYAFPMKSGGIQTIVSIDGWIKLVNRHPKFDGVEMAEQVQDGKLLGVTCTMHRSDRSHPICVTQWMHECIRDTEPWKQMPSRMLTHKAYIQCARYAFGFAGITDEDEAMDAIQNEPEPPHQIKMPRRIEVATSESAMPPKPREPGEDDDITGEVF